MKRSGKVSCVFLGMESFTAPRQARFEGPRFLGQQALQPDGLAAEILSGTCWGQKTQGNERPIDFTDEYANASVKTPDPSRAEQVKCKMQACPRSCVANP
jgi:hypothetical protein